MPSESAEAKRPVIHLAGVTRRFSGDVEALRGVQLTIAEGEFLAIEGPSGGGKSTLLNIIGLLDVPSAGDYTLNGNAVGALSARDRARARSDAFAFIFQSFHLLDRRPVLHSVELSMLYRAIPAAERRRRSLAALDAVGIARLASTRANLLSGGERQRVAIARALASGAPIVVADEPTGNLDSVSSERVMGSLRRLHASGATVIVVTHSGDVASRAERRVRIRDGRVVEQLRGEPRPKNAAPRFEQTGTASKLRFTDLLRDAWAAIGSRVGKTAGLAGAVSLGVALTVASLGISESARAQVTTTFDAHANREVTAEWSGSRLDNQSETQRTSLVRRLSGLHGVTDAAVVSMHDRVDVRAGTVRPSVEAAGLAIAGDFDALRADIAWADGHPHHLATGEVVIGDSLARRLELADLSAAPVVTINGGSFRVAGIIGISSRIEQLALSAVVSKGDAAVLSAPGVVRALLLTSPGAAQQVGKQVALVIDPYGPAGIRVRAPVDPRTLRAEVESDVQGTLFALTGIALLAAVVGLANAMMLGVLERRQEFGLRRAVGARASHVISQVITESAIIGGVGGMAGLALGMGGILAVTILQRWVPVFDVMLAPVAVIAGVVVGIAGGLAAAARAARIQPSDALRQ